MTSIPTHLCFPPGYNHLFHSPGTVFMNTGLLLFPSICLEGFLYGKISVLFFTFKLYPCQTSPTIPGLGLYFGIFAMYLECQSNKSTGRTATIVFYAICLLYVLSTVNFVSDLVILTILEVSSNSICSKNIIFYQLCRRTGIQVHRLVPLE